MSGLSRRDVLRYGAALTLAPALSMVGSLQAASPKRAERAAKKAAKKPGRKKAETAYADAVLVDGEPPLPADGSFTIVVLPDTQYYSESYPEEFLAQTDWIVQNSQKRNIACVLHLGDITNKNTAEQWEAAQKALNQLDGHVPYFMAVGNHDYAGDGSDAKGRSATKFNEYFPLAKFRAQPTFGGTYDREPERLENAYYLFSAGGRDFVVIVLEFGPRNDVVRWANEVAAKYHDREAIFVTHAYMYNDNTRYNWAQDGAKQANSPHSYRIDSDVNDGEELWQKLVAKQDNFILAISGHVPKIGLAQLVSPTPAGRDVPQIMVDFQAKPQGGDGWLRLLEFHADKRTVSVIDYSPTRKQCNESPQNKFTLETSPVCAK